MDLWVHALTKLKEMREDSGEQSGEESKSEDSDEDSDEDGDSPRGYSSTRRGVSGGVSLRGNSGEMG